MSTRKSALFYGLLIALVSIVAGMVIASRLDLTPRSSAADLTIPATNSDPITGPLTASTFRDIAEEAGPSVVSIITTMTREATGPGNFWDQLLPPGMRAPQDDEPDQQRVEGAGSGFIIDDQGYILTNNHVVEDAETIRVVLANVAQYQTDDWLPAKVVGRDELTDVALLQLTRLPSEGLHVAKFGDSGQMAPGDWVMAIGNPFALANTVTVGIVSAVGREQMVSSGRWEDFIQTDAAINRGNSGGPLLNLRGEVIGINSMIITGSIAQGNVGVGFAVPINTVRDLLPQLRTGKVTRGRIGVVIERRPMSEEYARSLGLSKPGGAEVTQVEPGGPADDGGIRTGDVIVEFNGKPVERDTDLVSMVAATKPDTTVPVEVVRGGKHMTLNVTVGELDLAAEQQASNGGGSRREPQTTDFGMTVSPLGQGERRQLQVPSGRGGAIITDIKPYGPAAEARLQEGDVILSITGQPMTSVNDVTSALEEIGSGRTARVIVWRFDPRTGQGQEVLIRLRKD